MSIAVSLIEDGVNDLMDVALIISADSDLCPAVRTLKRLKPRIRVIAAFPPKRTSDELKRAADGFLTIGDAHIRKSLLPPSVRNRDTGLVYTKPRRWA